MFHDYTDNTKVNDADSGFARDPKDLKFRNIERLEAKPLESNLVTLPDEEEYDDCRHRAARPNCLFLGSKPAIGC